MQLGLAGLGVTGRGGLNAFDLRLSMPPALTYTRTGTAMARTAALALLSFAANAPPRTDRGLALEAAATNVLLRSSEFGDAAWSKTNITVTGDSIAAPDGTMTADKIEATASAATSLTQLVAGAGAASGSAFTIFAKKGTGAAVANAFLLRNETTATNILWVRVNYDTGAITYEVGTTGATAEALADGWWKITLATPTGFSAGNGVRCYAGWFGAAATAGQFFYAWGAQLETGSAGTSPIPTAGASATRGLPVYTEPVPVGRTSALLTYADGTTTLVAGLTPGGTFDVATAVIGAGKGRVGLSELVKREWRT